MARNVSGKFGVIEGLTFSGEQGITELDVEKLVPFSKHGFTLYEGERFEDMKQSISKNGVMTPIIVRPMENGKFEILAGHNRVYAAGSVGLKTVPAVVKTDISDDEAMVYYIETNLLQRNFSDLKISEQAFAIALRYESLFDMGKLKRINDELYFIENGKRPADDEADKSESSDGDVFRMNTNNSRDITAEEYGISHATVARLLRVNKLTDELKALVDKKNICLRAAVDISYMTVEQQKTLHRLMNEMEVTVIDMKMGRQLRELVNTCAEVTDEHISEVLTGAYGGENEPKNKDKGKKVTLPTATYTRYLGNCSAKEAIGIIEKALAKYFEDMEEE